MTIVVIVLSIFSCYLLFRLNKRQVIDNSKVLSNRIELTNLAIDDWEHGKIDRELYRTLSYIFHPNFKNIWDYVPPERQSYTIQMHKLDSDFWELYKLTPDFAIPANIVYELYKDYIISQHVLDKLKNQNSSETT